MAEMVERAARGGPGGGGAGGMIFVAGSQVHLPSSLIQLAYGTGGSNPSGGVAPPGGGIGLLKLEGTLSLGVTSASSFDQLQVLGQLDGPDAIKFSLGSDAIADAFSSTFTFDSFFSRRIHSRVSGTRLFGDIAHWEF